MLLVLYKGFLFVICIIYLCEANIIVELQILNYHNQHNKMYNGKFCENLNLAGDHCDPMFTVKASTMNGRILFQKFVNFHTNTKSVGLVLKEKFEVKNFYDRIQVEVVVDDNDGYDKHDHIATFKTRFYSEKQNFRYFKNMYIFPFVMGVSLDASVLVKCIPDYYGKRCSQYCLSDPEFSCDPNTGIKICKIDCGFGECRTINDDWNKTLAICSCFEGWKGPNCKTEINITTKRNSDQISQHHLVPKSKLLPQQNDERSILAVKFRQPDKIESGRDVVQHWKAFQIVWISSLILSILVILIIGFKYWKLRHKIGNKSNNSKLYVLPESQYDACKSTEITEYDDDYLDPETIEENIYEKTISA